MNGKRRERRTNNKRRNKEEGGTNKKDGMEKCRKVERGRAEKVQDGLKLKNH